MKNDKSRGTERYKWYNWYNWLHGMLVILGSNCSQISAKFLKRHWGQLGSSLSRFRGHLDQIFWVKNDNFGEIFQNFLKLVKLLKIVQNG